MKKLLFSAALITIAGLPCIAQKAKQSPDTLVSPSETNRSAGPEALLDAGTRVDAELQGAVDVKRSKVGDQVILKTTRTVKQDGQTIIAKGSRLVGRITEVQERTKANGMSLLGMVFDRLEGKNLSTPINASIVSVTNAAATAAIADTAETDVFASSATTSSSSARQPRSSTGGGLLGGATNTTTNVLNTTAQTAGNVTNTVGNTIGSTTGAVGRTVNGIQINNSVTASAQAGSTLSARGKNIRLEKGSTIGVQINSSGQTR